MRAAVRMIIIAAMLMAVSGMARGADIRVLGIDAVQDVVRALAEEFGKQTGQQVELTFDSAQGLQEKIKGGAVFDALIASEASMDAFDSDGIVNPESRVRLPRAGAGVGGGGESAVGAGGGGRGGRRA